METVLGFQLFLGSGDQAEVASFLSPPSTFTKLSHLAGSVVQALFFNLKLNYSVNLLLSSLDDQLEASLYSQK